MSLNVIELNDAAVRVFRDGKIACESPGVAVIERNGLVVGNAAQGRAHLNPRAVNNRFWQQLNENPLPNATRKCRHHADLAYHHLSAVLESAGRPSEAVLAVSGSFDDGQLSLLLGIAAACNLKVSGLVDSAVAAVSGIAGPGRYAVADLHQHHATLTTVTVDDTARREAVRTIDQSGINRIHEACVDLIADAFLEQSRFDPLHEADTEQLLYNHLPAWLDEASRVQELHLIVEYHGNRFGAKISSREFLRVTQMVVSPIADHVTQDRSLLLTASLAGLPGCTVHLAPTQSLPVDACSRGIAEHRLAFGTGRGGVVFTSRLPRTTHPAIEMQPEQDRRDDLQSRVTHVLAGNVAKPLSKAPLFLHPDGKFAKTSVGSGACSITMEGGVATLNVQDADAQLNGQPIFDTCALRPGDHVTLNGGRALFVLIVVED